MLNVILSLFKFVLLTLLKWLYCKLNTFSVHIRIFSVFVYNFEQVLYGSHISVLFSQWSNTCCNSTIEITETTLMCFILLSLLLTLNIYFPNGLVIDVNMFLFIGPRNHMRRRNFIGKIPYEKVPYL